RSVRELPEPFRRCDLRRARKVLCSRAYRAGRKQPPRSVAMAANHLEGRRRSGLQENRRSFQRVTMDKLTGVSEQVYLRTVDLQGIPHHCRERPTAKATCSCDRNTIGIPRLTTRIPYRSVISAAGGNYVRQSWRSRTDRNIYRGPLGLRPK